MKISLATQHLTLSLLALAILTAAGAGKASETFQLCGPESSGFIRTGSHTACVGGSLNWARNRPAPTAAAKSAAAASTLQQQTTTQPGER